MNQEQLMSVLRQLLLFGGGVLVARGSIDEATLDTVVGALLALAASAWALYRRRAAGLVAAAAALPEVGRIVAAPDLAEAVPNAKVVGPS